MTDWLIAFDDGLTHRVLAGTASVLPAPLEPQRPRHGCHKILSFPFYDFR
jgi:hypothetical protein